jgi:hypothetical protein
MSSHINWRTLVVGANISMPLGEFLYFYSKLNFVHSYD